MYRMIGITHQFALKYIIYQKGKESNPQREKGRDKL